MTPDLATGRRRAPAMSPEQRREMIVQAAVPLVTEYGAAVTTSQIARAAGIAEGTVFRAFADKNEVLQACVAEALRPDRVQAELAAISLDQPLAGRLADAAEALEAHLSRMGALIGALQASGGLVRPAPDGENEGCPPIDAGWEVVADLFEPEHAALRLPAEQLASMFVSLLFQRGRFPGGPTTPTIHDLIDLFLHGALTGADATPHEGAPQ